MALQGSRAATSDLLIAATAIPFNMNARIQGGTDPGLLRGIQVDVQYWHSDPVDAFHIGLTDGLTFVIRP